MIKPVTCLVFLRTLQHGSFVHCAFSPPVSPIDCRSSSSPSCEEGIRKHFLMLPRHISRTMRDMDNLPIKEMVLIRSSANVPNRFLTFCLVLFLLIRASSFGLSFSRCFCVLVNKNSRSGGERPFLGLVKRHLEQRIKPSHLAEPQPVAQRRGLCGWICCGA